MVEKTDDGFTIRGAAQGIDQLGGIGFDQTVFTTSSAASVSACATSTSTPLRR